MRPSRHLLSPVQRAWLTEMGVDARWLAPTAPQAVLPTRSAPDGARLETPQGPRDALPAPAHPRGPDRDEIRPGAPVPSPAAVPVSTAVPVTRPASTVQGASDDRRATSAGLADHPVYFILGEQPGIEDGGPFQGDTGTLLRAMLTAARLPSAESAYFTTVVKQRGAGGREPSAADIAASLPDLRQEIARVQPQWILALGRVAAQAVLGSDQDLETRHGGPHEYRAPDGSTIPVWVTYHPASLLVRAVHKPVAWRDLAALAQAVAARSGVDGEPR